MWEQTVSSDMSYYHAVHRSAVTGYAGVAPPAWASILALRSFDRRVNHRRFARSDTGTMYFGESQETVRAEMRIGSAAAPAGLGLYTGPGTRAMFWLYEVRFRPGKYVLAITGAMSSAADRGSFETQYGVSPAACLLDKDYAPSHRVARSLPVEVRGVSYPSVRRSPDGHCLAMYHAAEDVESSVSSGVL